MEILIILEVLGVVLFLVVLIPFFIFIIAEKSHFFEWRSIVFSVIFFVSGIMMLIGSTAWKNNAIINSPFFLLFNLIVILFSVFMFVLTKLMSAKNMKEQARKEAESIVSDFIEKNSLAIYSKCFENGIYSLDSGEDIDGLMIISRMYGVTDIKQAKEWYAKGQLLFQEQKERKLKRSREYEAKINKENKEKAETSPTDKYLYGIKTLHAACTFNAILSESGMSGASDTMRYRAQRSDSAIWGGIADGLAGPGAGIATAMDIEAQNARSEAEAAQSRANARDSYDYHQKVLLDSRGKQYSLERRIEYVNGLVYDEQNINEKFQMLSISTPSYKIYAPKSGNSTSKSVVVTFRIESVKPVTLFKKKAILDGSLRIVLKNSSGNTIGEGFYCAPGFDESRLTSGRIDSIQYEIKKLEKVGFVDCVNQDIRVSCYIYDSYFEQLSSDDNLKIEIEPVKMWIIEGKLKG